MAGDPIGPFQPLSLGQRPGLSHDARQDSGYGVSKDKFHKPRQNATSFPYTDNDSTEPLDPEDEVLAAKIADKIGSHQTSDFLIGRSKDPFALANGNLRVGIGESAKNSLVPFPAMYKNRIQVGGGATSPKLISPGQYNRTGTRRGWSKAPVPLDTGLDVEQGTASEEIDADEYALKKVRQVVRSVLRNNAKGI